MPVRLKDIANTTASLALGEFANETRQRVEQTTLEMGCYPNSSAQKLQKQRTDTIGFIIPTSGPRFADPFWSDILAGLGNETSQQGKKGGGCT